MKKTIFFLLIGILSLNAYSQIVYESGYLINNKNQKIECLIKNVDWRNNPRSFEYKLSENGKSEIGDLKSVKEFGIPNSLKYVKKTIEIDVSSEKVNELGEDRNPDFQNMQLFLKVLVEGQFTLYEYMGDNLKRYFYSKDEAHLEQLIFKSYKTADNKIAKNNRFRQQLWADVKCPEYELKTMNYLDYDRNELVDFFIESNQCQNQEVVNYAKKQKRDFFNLNIRPRLKSSSLSVRRFTSSGGDTDISSQISFGIGLEAEFILPLNKNKWAIIVEPTYQSFKAEESNTLNSFLGTEVTAKSDYSSIELPLGVRHYFFLNEKSKIFINASYFIDVALNSTIEYATSSGQTTRSFEIKSGTNFAFGMGYNFNNRYSLELRYQTDRQLLENFIDWSAKYSTPISLIVGYRLF
ncbi:MAG: outer membrane beta-barrel protein [Bacteroidota bacterium]